MLAGAPDGAAEDGLELDASLLRISAIENELPWTLADIIPVLVGFETKKYPFNFILAEMLILPI